MVQIESPPHPLDDLIKREDSSDIPMTTFHYAHSQDLPFTLVIVVEICSNFISSDLVNILGLTRWVHPEPYYLGPNYAGLVLSQCKVPFNVGHYEAELVCDVVDVKTFGVLLGQNWIKRMGVRYNRRRKTFIYPWMKKASPQPEPSLQSIPVPESVVEPEPLLEPEPVVESEPFVEPEPMVEPEPFVESEQLMEPEPLVEPESDPSPKLVPESAPEEVKLLHEYLDPFLPPEPGIPSFQLCLDELLLWWIVDFLTPSLFIRSTRMGLHHQLLETRLDDFPYINSRTSFSHQGSLMRSSSENGWANPTF